jgi:sulfatase maturation enzyme AslB (radical SAM superfamily)
MDIFRYRIITNLQCNNRCTFCYQTFKPKVGSDIVLSPEKMEETMRKVFKSRGKLRRATLMGGETLLLANAADYVEIANTYANTTCCYFSFIFHAFSVFFDEILKNLLKLFVD